MALIRTIGHSTHTGEHFLALVIDAGIEVIVDLRSQPYSRFAPQFNQAELRRALSAAGIRYLYMGDELGGRPPSADMYDSEGFVLYSAMAESDVFASGIELLERGAEQFRVGVMCSEENPTECHRHLLVARVLVDRGHDVSHIRGSGAVESYRQVELRRTPTQLSLVAQEGAPWRSTRSVSPRSRRRSSSGY